ncbi:MAG: acyl-CoA dehydrogenase [Nitriliruptoraceae bacterium]
MTDEGHAMSHYKSNLRDIEFNLFEVLGADGYLGTGPFAEVDGDQARMLLEELDRFSRESIWAESFAPADREPLELSEEGDVRIPAMLDEALHAFYDAGWHLMPLPTHLGGFGAPPTIRWAGTELLAGGNATASLWPIGSLMAGIIDEIGTEGQKAAFARPLVEDRWGGTMVLTEPDAGSDVGAGVTKATFKEASGDDDLGDVYHLEGIKRFITSADAQTHPNTVHLVLARPEGAGPGTKGLSLFLVPKRHIGAGGDIGERNGVRVSNLEKKMGIKGSATCELSLGQDGEPCVGYLAGNVHEGIKQMFLVIEYARMMVGTKAMSTLSTGYLNALEYAKVRVQGADMTRASDKSAPKVEIINHPDVRRMLMEQKAHAEGMRALVYYAGWVQDQAQLATHPETGEGADHDEHDRWIAREDLLLPLVKGYCSEKAYELLGSSSLQTFGGSGYTQDYPIEQYIRDAKIDTLYEGTTAIQALDLLFRKIVRDQGATLTWFADQIRSFVKGGVEGDPFTAERERLHTALEAAQSHLGVLLQHAMASMDESQRTEVYKTGLQATAFLTSLSEVMIGWLLLRHAEVAHDALEAGVAGDRDQAFYHGKIASARYFARAVLPKVSARAQGAAEEDGSLMAVPEDAF